MATSPDRVAGRSRSRHRVILAVLLLVGSPFIARSGLTQIQGGTAACVCYCGIQLRPPCGDESCKSACGWRAPSTGGGGSIGGAAAGAAAGAISNAISNSIRNAFEQNRAREAEAARQQQMLQEQNEQMMRAMDQMSRERSLQEDQMFQDAAQRARRLEDQNRQEALSSLKSVTPGEGDLTLKPATSFFGIPANPQGSAPTDPSVVDLRNLDPNKPVTVDPNALKDSRDSQKPAGGRVMDCGQGRATRNRLAAGLPVQQTAIQRTEAQLESAGKGIEEARTEGKGVLLKGALDEAKAYAQEVLTSAKALRGQIEALNDLDKAKRDALIRATNALVFGGEDLYHSGQAGAKAGEEMQKKADRLSRQVADLADKLLMDSGIAEKAGEELAGKLWGPLGELGFRGAKLSIDLSVAVGKGMISKTEYEAAQRHLETMKTQYKRAEERMTELDRDLGELCKESVQVKQ